MGKSCQIGRKYYRLDSGMIIGYFEESGVKHYILPNSDITLTAPTDFHTNNRVEPIRDSSLLQARQTVGSENVLSGNTLTLPETANYAEIHVWANNCSANQGPGIIWTIHGQPPSTTANIGNRTSAGNSIELESRDELENFKFEHLGSCSDTSIFITYFHLEPVHVE